MSVFGKDYATYYDMLYQNKDYGVEADYVADLLKDAGVTSGELLDVGCGTGKHLLCMKNKGFSVSGVDMSENMIEKARSLLGSGADLQVARSDSFSFKKKFNAVTSLFHVMSYLTKTDDVMTTFNNVSEHLNYTGGGIII